MIPDDAVEWFAAGIAGTSIAALIWCVHQVSTTCQRTNETRPGPTTYVMSGKVLVPISTTQRRYICKDGDIWL